MSVCSNFGNGQGSVFVLPFLVDVDSRVDQNTSCLDVAPHADAVESAVAQGVRRVDVVERNVAEVRRLSDLLKQGFQSPTVCY